MMGRAGFIASFLFERDRRVHSFNRGSGSIAEGHSAGLLQPERSDALGAFACCSSVRLSPMAWWPPALPRERPAGPKPAAYRVKRVGAPGPL